MDNSQRNIFSYIQRQSYAKEIASLSKPDDRRPRVSKSSSLFKLCPIHENGVLRVGGRLENADLSFETKHPIILPYRHHVTDLVIRNYHERSGHVGFQHVLSQIRQQLWIVHGIAAVKRVIGRCFDCKRRCQPPMTQLMAPLPAERLIPDKPPFTYVGIDYFGPMYVKVGRSQHKRYGCLFTCLTTRAVHIEIAHSLDADSFIGALTRFISRRGKPQKAFSDNGTNFTKGERELNESIKAWNQTKIHTQLLQAGIEWHFNPPFASHMGGVWERLIQSTKKILRALVKEQMLNDESLATFMAEVEKILNDRPLTGVSTDARDPEPLTPNKLLILHSNSCIPVGVFNKDERYCKRWWRQAQYMSNIFWRRWIREYLPNLQLRTKWQTTHRNVKVNDLVLVVDESSPRGQWPLGRVLEVKPGRDGLVRSCKVKCGHSVKVRPITKLCLLEQDTD